MHTCCWCVYTKRRSPEWQTRRSGVRALRHRHFLKLRLYGLVCHTHMRLQLLRPWAERSKLIPRAVQVVLVTATVRARGSTTEWQHWGWQLNKANHVLDGHTDTGLSLLMLTNLTKNGWTPTSLTLLIITVAAASIDMALTIGSILLPVFEDTYYLQTVVAMLVCEAVVLGTTAVALKQQLVMGVQVSGGELAFLIMSGTSTVSTFLISLWTLRSVRTKMKRIRSATEPNEHRATCLEEA